MDTNVKIERQLWSKVVVKALSDDQFKEQLIKDTAQTLKECGLDIQGDKKYHIHENSDKKVYLVIPYFSYIDTLDINLTHEEIMEVKELLSDLF